MNIAVVTNSIPNTGITLPFVSYGGTSVCFLLAEMGIRLKRIRPDKAVAKAPRKASLHMIIYNRCREEQAFRGRLAVERYEIDGGRPLVGEVSIQGSKNAVLPMMAAAVLHQGTVVCEHCPVISDDRCMVRILEKLGCTVNWEGHTLID